MTNGEMRLRELVQRLDTIAAEIYKEGYEHTAGGSARGAQLNMLATEFAEALAATVQAKAVKDAQTGARDEMADHLAPSSGRRKSEQDAGASPASPALSIPESVQAEVGAGDALSKRITYYLAMGGLWNPESMDHNGVRQLLIDCREGLAARPDVAGGRSKAYRCWFHCPTCRQEHEVQWETYEKPDFSCQSVAAEVGAGDVLYACHSGHTFSARAHSKYDGPPHHCPECGSTKVTRDPNSVNDMQWLTTNAGPVAARPDVAGGALREGGQALALATVTYGQPKEFPAKVKIFVFGVGTGIVDAAALRKTDVADGGMREAVIAEMYKRHPQLGARSIDEFADFVAALALRAAGKTLNEEREKLLDHYYQDQGIAPPNAE